MTLKKVYSIKELSNAVNNALSDINIVTIEGEVVLPMIRDNRTNKVTEKKLDPYGHWYFPLKDLNEPDDYQFDVTVFSYNRVADIVPKNGDVVQITGYVNRPNISVYSKTNKLSFRGYKVEISGTGQFYASFKRTYRKLEPLGYFDPLKKKAIPPYPMRIAVISGKQTAALRDVVFQIESRWPCAETLVFPAIMQGDTSPGSVMKALRQAEGSRSDIIIIARGGGSVSELWCFNDEQLAHAIFACKTPVIVGVGHKQDDTIAGLTADLNAATPTEAGMKATPVLSEVRKQIDDSVESIHGEVVNRILLSSHQQKICEMELDKVRRKAVTELNSISSLAEQMKEALNRIPENRGKDLYYLKNQLSANGKGLYSKTQLQVHNLKTSLNSDIQNYYRTLRDKLILNSEMIESLGPLSVLRRGYSVSRQNDKVLRSVDDIDFKEEMETRYADGYVISRPLKKEKFNG